jgi:hypothetical protein
MDHVTKSVADLENDIESALEHLRDLDLRGKLPPELRPLLLLAPVEGSSVHVSLRHRDTVRQIRRAHGAQAFAQRACGAWIVFEAPQLEWHDEGGREAAPHVRPFDEFIRALHQAEHEPQLHFVSLKWFRDTYLQKCGFAWAQEPDAPRRLLQEATDRGLVLTSKVPNPKTPAFPVTSIHLNREHPDLQRILGSDAPPPRSGDPASEPRGPHETRAPSQGESRAEDADQLDTMRVTNQ